ncbi:MAG: hypothetical protein ACRC62_35980 [Microcoleus sp.]
MATISSPSLTVENINATVVKLTVKYTLTPNAVEKLAGTVFTENIQAIGDDAGVLTDVVISNFPADSFAVSAATPTVVRTRVRNVLKSSMNEDPEFLLNGGELSDEVLGRITLSYAANPPIPAALPSPTSTNTVSAAWK